MNKKESELTFKEFWEKEEEKDTDKETVEKDKRVMVEILHEKGFTDEQIDEMKMDRVQRICWSVMLKTIETHTKAVERSVSKVSKQYKMKMEELATLWKIPKKRELLVRDKRLRKDLLELGAGMNDLEKGLFESEELARQFLEELMKKREELKKKEKKA